MPVFTYRGTNRTGTPPLRANAKPDSKAAADRPSLRRQQINVSKMSEKGKEFNMPTFGAGVDPKELAIFTRQFSVMIDAGLPLVQCLEILAGQQENKTFQKILNGDASVGGRRRHSFRVHEAARKGLRRSVRQPGGSGRDGRYSRHDSAAPFVVHRKERQAEARREVRDGLSGRGVEHRGGRDHSACFGRSCRFSPRCSSAWARTCRCRRASSSAEQFRRAAFSDS